MMQRVKRSLEVSRIPFWTDEGIQPGTPSWKLAIEEALEKSACMVVLLSPDAKSSIWVRRELDYAEAQGVQILALMVRGDDATSIPFALIGSQYVDIREDYDSNMNRLLPKVGQLLSLDIAPEPSSIEVVTQLELEPEPAVPPRIEIISESEPSTERGEIAEQPETPDLKKARIDGPIKPATRNSDWTPVIRTINGIEMVLVPPGCFLMGSKDFDNSQPVHRRCIERAFWIGRYPVTNAEFNAAVTAGICEASEYIENKHFNNPQQPVVGVNWHNALRYARWKQMRLPTETEWEYAARGPENWEYPWGNDFEANNLVYIRNSRDKTAPIGSHLGGISWVGALDLSGNVREWCLTAWQRNYFSVEANQDERIGVNRVLRGSSWSGSEGNLQASYRYSFQPDRKNRRYGFRVICMAPIS